MVDKLIVPSKLKTINFQDVTLYLNLENKTLVYMKILNQINHIWSQNTFPSL